MTDTPSSASDHTPADKQPYVFPTADSHPSVPEEKMKIAETEPSESALDHGVDESFPASDPVSVTVTKAVTEPATDHASRESATSSGKDTAPSTEFDTRNALAGDRGAASGRNIEQDREVRQHDPAEGSRMGRRAAQGEDLEGEPAREGTHPAQSREASK